MNAEPQLRNLSSESPAKYQQYLGAEGFPIRCGILNLDAIFLDPLNSDKIVLPLYQYAQLVQRIFYLSDPTLSKSTQVVLPNTFAEFKVAFQNDMAKYSAKLRELVGYGGTGFPHNVATQTRYGLMILFDIEHNVVISGQLLIVKNIQTTPTSAHLVLEIWSMVADPLYMKSGAGTSLLLSTLYASVNIVYYLFEEARRFAAEVIAPAITIELEVAKNSFPFIDFMDRFVLYARNGFSYATGSLSALAADDTPYQMNLAQFEFESKYHQFNLQNKATVKDVTSGKSLAVSLDEWKIHYSVSLPNPTDQIIFRTKPMNQYDMKKVYADVLLVFGKIKRLTMDQTLPLQMCWLSHTGYIPSIEGNISTFKVPANMEIIIMNSPGFSTTSFTIPKNWNMNAKYFRNIPIDYLKKLFPPFKTVREEEDEVVSLESYNSFAYATSGGVLFNVSEGSHQEYIQTHCYNAGDDCPNMVMSCMLGNTTDWLASMFGMYIISLPIHYSALKMTNNVSKLNSMGGLLFNPTAAYMKYLRDVNVQWPDKAYRQFPNQAWLSQNGYLPDSVKNFEITLRDFLVRNPSPTKVRLCIFSCGNIGNAIDEKIKHAWSTRLNHTYKINMLDYEKRINRLGEAIFDIYNTNVRSFGLSPESVAATRATSVFQFIPIKPVSRGISRKSKKPSSRRVSRGSKKNKGTRRASKQSNTVVSMSFSDL